MRNFILLFSVLASLSTFSCPVDYDEVPDTMKMQSLYGVKFPLHMNLNYSLSFTAFEDSIELYSSTQYPYPKIILSSLNGVQDHEQIFIPHKLRLVESISAGTLSTSSLKLTYDKYHDTYADFKVDTNGVISFCYQAKSPIEYR